MASHLQTSGFEHIIESLEIQHAREALDRRSDEVEEAVILEVIRIGQHAIKHDQVTHDTIKDVTWDTVARQRQLIKAVGYNSLKGAPSEISGNNGTMDILSQTVDVGSGLRIRLSQTSRGSGFTVGFWDMVKEEGLEAALDHYCSPVTTSVQSVDAKSLKTVTSVTLAPQIATISRRLEYEWGDFLPFKGAEYFSPYRRSVVKNTTPLHVPMTDQDLVVAAGYNALFNGLLDEVEANL